MTTTHQQDGNRLPATGAGFFWDTDPVLVLRPTSNRAVAAFTTRVGGVSTGPYTSLNISAGRGDDPDHVATNRSIAGRTIGASEHWSKTKQVHGTTVVPAQGPDDRVPADAQWTNDPMVTLAAYSADCVLLLFTGPDRIAVAHAGWRGMAAGIVENAAGSVGATQAFAGPAIGPCCFEVGPEVIEAFSATYPNAVTDPSHVDLWLAAESAALRAGVDDFHAARICTSCHPDLFFSHRRDNGRTGRQALLARIADA